MSKYTTEVRYMCEYYAGYDESKGYGKVDDIISEARSMIFDFDYPIFDESYRSVLECKILKHYYTYEIGEETVGLWKLRLNTKMNEIMPYYNKLYESELLEFNPLYTHDLRKEGTTSNDRTEDLQSNVTDSNTRYNAYSDTPQGSLQNVINDSYLTNAEKTTDSGSSVRSGDNSISDTGEYLEHTYGYAGKDVSELVLKYRKTFLNIDVSIIKELEELFMMIW